MFLIACNETEAGEGKGSYPDNWKKIEREAFSLYSPDTLVADSSGMMGTSLILFGKPDTLSRLPFRTNINIIVQDLKGMNFSFEDYLKLTEEQIKALFKDGVMEKTEKFTRDGKPWAKLEYTGTTADYKLAFLQYITLIDEKAYLFTLTASPEYFSSWKKLTEKIVNSVQIK
jgi:hypothetical protein